MRALFASVVAVFLMVGCANMQVQTYAKEVTPDRIFGNIKSVAVLPFEALS
jgi:hypothetical protein